MKANEFVKKFGWEEAKEIVGGLPEKFKFKPLGSVCWDNNTYKYSDRFKPRSSLVNMADLKRLVESWELVNEFDDIEQARSWIPDMDEEMPYQVRGSNKRFFKGQLIEAIADVESCQ